MDHTPKDDWISALTRPLRVNPELHLEARRELGELAAHADNRDLTKIKQRLEEVDQASPRRRRWLFWALLGCALLVVTAEILHGLRLRNETSFAEGPSAHHDTAAAYFRPRMSEEDYFFVFGDTAEPSPMLAARALWQTEPDNPLLFANYIAHCRPLPPDMLEHAERIDPDNGWYLLLAAAEAGDGSVDIHYPHSTAAIRNPPPDWIINDQEGYDQSIALLQRALTKPRLRSHRLDLLKQRLEVLPPEHDLRSRFMRLRFASSADGAASTALYELRYIVAARADLLARRGATTELEEWENQLHDLFAKLHESEVDLLGEILIWGMASVTYQTLEQAQKATGMPEAALATGALNKRIETSSPGARNPGSASEWERLGRQAGVFTKIFSRSLHSLGGPVPTAEDLRPERMMNYALLDRAALVAGSLVLLVLTGLPALLRHVRGTYARLLGRRIAALPNRRDRLWILGFGLALPITWLLGVTRLTPLGCRDWGLTYAHFQPVLTQYVLGLLLILVATLHATRNRLRQWNGSTGLIPPARLWNLLPLLLVALAIPVAGLTRYATSEFPLHASWALGGLALLWMLFRVVALAYGQGRFSGYRAALAGAVIPSLALAALVLLALLPSTHLAERTWFARDTLWRSSAENHGSGQMIVETAKSLRTSLHEALNPGPSP